MCSSSPHTPHSKLRVGNSWRPLKATGTAMAIRQLQKLRLSNTQGLFALEGSIARLEDWVGSLAEVVLQYCRALVLLCAEQGGYCMVFGETCCFYENHSGITMN